MRLFVSFVVVLTALAAIAPLRGEEGAQESLSDAEVAANNQPRWPEISGFLDVIGSYRNSGGDRYNFAIGQAEIDLAQTVSNRVSAALSLCYNNQTGSFDLGSAELYLTLRSQPEHFLSNATLVAGQFDVPIGIEYNYFCSIDRETITAPWHNHAPGNWYGWNDYGVRLELETQLGNAKAYVVNGFDDEAQITSRVFNLSTGFEEDTTEVVNTAPDIAFGERLGWTIIPTIEFGSSLALGLNPHGAREMAVAAVDLQFTHGAFSARSEWIRHWRNRSVSEARSDGFYLQAMYQLGFARLHSRFAQARQQSDGWQDQLSAGVGLKIYEQTELRGEWLIDRAEDAQSSFVQLLVSF